MNCKIIRDPIYGYITIPDDYIKHFVDTKIFQRLRRIEQTSMRALYPSAHHDRFVHSIGVYHLGHLAFKNLRKNSDKLKINEDDWKKIEKSFEIACLMHDCGHAPFSHTFEQYYVYQKETEINSRLESKYIVDVNFKSELSNAAPAAHEKISCLVVLEHYYESILTCGGDPLLVGRMIMGCIYKSNLNEIQKIHNKFIKLLNGTAIDVDSLDYIQRDSWASGVNNVSIDYVRLLGALELKLDEFENPIIGFKKHAMSVLENINIGRNFLYKWIYSHNKVIYDQYLLKSAVEFINEKTNGEFCKKIFSIEALFQPQTFNNIKYYLPTDDDIYSNLKHYFEENSIIDEYLNRKYKFKALWKTQTEFENIFKEISFEDRIAIENEIKNGALNDLLGENNHVILEAKPKLKGFASNTFFIFIGDQKIDAAKIVDTKDEQLKYFFLYINENDFSRRDEIIKRILMLRN